MSVEEKFKAAVNVIRSLPKSGSYQPSNELMLRFYSHFKQATEGPCDKTKPGFWDVVNRAKWEAWHKLGDMARDEAMETYVDDLHQIVETMSLSEDVVSFLQASGSGYDVSADDLELVAGDVLERVRSKHNTPMGSPSASRAPSPVTTTTQRRTNIHSVGSAQSVPESEDEYIDTIEDDTESVVHQSRHTQIGNGHISSNGRSRSNTQLRTKALSEVPAMLLRLERDVAALRSAVETQNSLLKNSRPQHPSWWPFSSVSPALAAFLVFWPILAVRIDRAITRRSN